MQLCETESVLRKLSNLADRGQPRIQSLSLVRKEAFQVLVRKRAIKCQFKKPIVIEGQNASAGPLEACLARHVQPRLVEKLGLNEIAILADLLLKRWPFPVQKTSGSGNLRFADGVIPQVH